ncbi:MAG: carbohydrate ABC transporter permease [Cellulomonas sp.]
MRQRLAVTGKYSSLVIGCLVALIPLVVLVFTSLKSAKDYATSGPLNPPTHITFANFVTAFRGSDMGTAFLNTTIIMVVSIVGTILIGTMTAYAIDRFEFRFKKMVVGLFLLATLVPGVTTQVATFQVINKLGLYDTRMAPIALFMGTDIVSIYIFVQFMRSIPISLDEAATLDGANHFAIYRRIILPLLRPAIATVVVIKGIGIYNEFYIPYLYMPDKNLVVVSTALQRFKSPMGTQWEILSAGALIVIVPTLIIFLVLQRYIYNGLSAGSVK